MKKLLSLLLCVCLLVNMAAPSFAQSLPVAVAKEGLARVLTDATLDASLSRALFRSAIQNGIEQGVYQESLASLGNIYRQFDTGNLQGLGEQILMLPDAQVRSWMMRNEMALLGVNKSLSASVLEKAVHTYQSNLQKSAPVFKQIPSSIKLSTFLQQASTEPMAPAAKEVLGILADASSLALLGSEKDVPALLAFYENARGTIFQDVAGVIVARGCLRYGAYDALNEFMQKEAVKGTFWKGLSHFAKEHNLPLTVPAGAIRTEEALIYSEKLTNYLAKASPLVSIQGDFSTSATETWLALGTEKLPLTHRTRGPQKPRPMVQKEETVSVRPLLKSNLQQDVVAPKEEVSKNLQTTVSSAQQTGTKPYSTPSITEIQLLRVAPITVASSSVRPPLVAQEKTTNTARPPLKAAAEPAGLHENSVREVYQEIMLPPAYEAEDYVSEEALPTLVPIAGEGFKFTLERGGEETILDNVDVSISAAIKLANGYNRLVQREDNVFEVRNQSLDPKKMERFFFALSTANGELKTLIEAAAKIHTFYPLRVKVKREDSEDSLLSRLITPFKRLGGGKDIVQIPLHSTSKMGPFILADLDVSLLPVEMRADVDKGYLTVQGKRLIFHSAQGKTATLSHFYVRLPKEESAKWTQILQNNPQTHFSLNVYPTENKTGLMTYVVSLLRVGTGKIFGPIMRFLGLPDWSSTAIPLFANNGMSLLLGPLMPMIRRMGDANVYRMGVALYALSAMSALTLGFNGFMGLENATMGQIGGFIGVLFGMGIAGTLVNTVNNPLLASNAGKITLSRKKGGKKAVVARESATAPTVSFLAKRAKEVFTTKNVEMRNSVIYQLASAMKNVATFSFAAWPFLFNLASEAVGSSVRADFSLGFWFLAGVSLYSLYKVMSIPLKDSFPRNLAVLHRMSVEKEAQVIKELQTQLLANPQAKIDFSALVKQLNNILGPYARQTSYVMKEKEKEVSASMEAETILHIKAALEKANISPEVVARTTQGLQDAFGSLGRRNANMRDILKKPAVLPALAAMTLLTIHELGTSSEFAFAVNDSLKQLGLDPKNAIALGTFLSALFLYAPSFFFRLAGNWLALRMSEGSMYALSSSASMLGTGLMIASGGNLPILFTGALFATFGMGNFFSQVYEYIMSLQPKYRAELAVMIGYTMPVAAALTAGVRALASWGLSHGVYGAGLMACGAALVGSFFAAPGMFADSNLTKSIQYYMEKIKNFFKGSNGQNPSPSEAAAQ